MPTLSIPKERYIDDESELHENRRYNQTNYNDFIKTICSESNLHGKLSTAIQFLQAHGATKYVKCEKYALADGDKTRLPCSVIKLALNNKEKEFSYYLMTPLCLGAPGANGVVKVVVQVVLEKGGYKLCFSKPAALKIIYKQTFDADSWRALCDQYAQYYPGESAQQQRRVDKEIYKRSILMPIIQGKELYNFFNDQSRSEYGAFSVPECIEICLAIANSLAENFHNKNRLHGDLKQENIYLSREGRHGSRYVAHFIDIDDGIAIGAPFQAKTMAMTLEYIPPEFIQSIKSTLYASFSAEIYSLGIIFSEVFGLFSSNKIRGEKNRDLSCFPEYICDLRHRYLLIAMQFPIKFAQDIMFSEAVTELFQEENKNLSELKRSVISPFIQLLKEMCNPEPTKRPNLSTVTEKLHILAHEAARYAERRPCRYYDMPIVAQDFISMPPLLDAKRL